MHPPEPFEPYIHIYKQENRIILKNSVETDRQTVN